MQARATDSQPIRLDYRAEVGRQPWTVYNYLRTADSVSITVGGGELVFSLVMPVLSSITAFRCTFCAWRYEQGPEVPQTAGGIMTLEVLQWSGLSSMPSS